MGSVITYVFGCHDRDDARAALTIFVLSFRFSSQRPQFGSCCVTLLWLSLCLILLLHLPGGCLDLSSRPCLRDWFCVLRCLSCQLSWTLAWIHVAVSFILAFVTRNGRMGRVGFASDCLLLPLCFPLPRATIAVRLL